MVLNIDINENTYDAKGIFNQVWCDPRKTFNPVLGTYQLTNDAAADIAVK